MTKYLVIVNVYEFDSKGRQDLIGSKQFNISCADEELIPSLNSLLTTAMTEYSKYTSKYRSGIQQVMVIPP
jgi:hypothetical protein